MPDLGEDDILITGFVTAFIDLLGISDRLLRFDGLSDDPNPAVRDDIYETLRHILKFREDFRSFYAVYFSPGGHEPPAPLPPKERALWDSTFAKGEPVIQQFADSVLVSIPVEIARPVAFLRAVDGMFLGCAVSSVMMLARGTAVRGGIGIGYAAKLDSGEVVGSGQVKAHRIEELEAGVPRIVVDPELLAVLQPPRACLPEWSKREFSLIQAMWTEAQSSLVQADDGYVFIDFLGPQIAKVFRTNHSIDEVREFCGLIEKSIASNLVATRKQRRVNAKWCWLRTYWQSCRHWWSEEVGQ